MIERFSHDRAIISLISTSSDNFAYPDVVGISTNQYSAIVD